MKKSELRKLITEVLTETMIDKDVKIGRIIKFDNGSAQFQDGNNSIILNSQELRQIKQWQKNQNIKQKKI